MRHVTCRMLIIEEIRSQVNNMMVLFVMYYPELQLSFLKRQNNISIDLQG